MVKNEVSLTFYGGVDEIGGNKILLKDGDARIFLDFGMSYTHRKKYYSPPFLAPKSERSLQELGILPKIQGIYKFDNLPPSVDAVFLSHGHLDHSAYLSFFKREIPVYCGETTQTILQSLSKIRRTDLEFNVADLNFKVFRTGDSIRIGNLVVQPFHVDHSVPGAYGFVIETSHGSVIYTGDFRNHGARPKMTEDFTEKARASEPVAVISEGTNMIGAYVSSEAEVESKLDSITSQTEGIVLAEFGYSDVDRLNSFYRIAKRNNRRLAVSLKQAHLLSALQMDEGLKVPNLDEDDLLIFRKSKRRFDKWECDLINKYENERKIFDVFEVSKKQRDVVLAISFYDFEELVALQPATGSCYVLSASEPFNEEMEIDYEKLINWLRHYGLPQYHAHVSGHMMPLQLKATLKAIGGKQVFPVHTEQADLFSRFICDQKTRVKIVEKGKVFSL